MPETSSSAAVQPQQQFRVPPVVGGVEKFEAIFQESLLLWNISTSATLFTHPAWIRAYLSAFEPAADLIVITARYQGRLIGVLPLIRERSRFYGMPVRLLRAPTNSHCHVVDVMREDGAPGREALAAMWSMLRTLDVCDVIELPRMVIGGAADELIALAINDGWRGAQGVGAANLAVPVRPGVGKETDSPWQANATSGLRKDLRRAARQLQAELKRRHRIETILNPTRKDMSAFFWLEASGWKGAEHSAIISAPATHQFYREIAERFAEAGVLGLNFLYFGGQLAAAQIGIRVGDAFHGLKLAYNEEFSRYSPGGLLLNELLRVCWGQGIRKLELGPDGEYKRRWTNEEVRVATCFLFREGTYGQLLHNYKFVARPYLRNAVMQVRQLAK
jgi:CelD/BcsL family acetyltransferase involved in cellulose biosynthesis